MYCVCAEDDQGAAVVREDGSPEEPAALRGSPRSTGELPKHSASALLRLNCRSPLNSSLLSQVTREERMVVKPLYDRYRLVKQMLTRVSITPVIVRAHKQPFKKRHFTPWVSLFLLHESRCAHTH